MRLVILDRDDTLIRLPARRRYVYGEDEIVLADGVVPFLQRLSLDGVAVAVATNQQGIALPDYPDMTFESVDRFHQRLLDELNRRRAPVQRIYSCPHSDDAKCACRKPRPGLFLQAMRDFGVDPTETAAIGDRWRDAQAARAAGIRRVFLIQNGESVPAENEELTDVRIVSNFESCLSDLLM